MTSRLVADKKPHYWLIILWGVLVLALLAGDVAAAADPARRLTGRPTARSAVPWTFWWQIMGVTLAYAFSYGVSFVGLFPVLLHGRTGPLLSYGYAWMIFWILCTIATMSIFFRDLLPEDWNDRTPFIEMYWRHVVVLAIGTALAIGSVMLSRSSPAKN